MVVYTVCSDKLAMCSCICTFQQEAKFVASKATVKPLYLYFT